MSIKPLAILALSLLASSACAQSTSAGQRSTVTPPRTTYGDFLLQQEMPGGCAIQVTKASFARPAKLVLVAATGSSRSESPTLRLDLVHFALKPIRSVKLALAIKTKSSAYQLDSTEGEFVLDLKPEDHRQSIALAESVLAVTSVAVRSVEYFDGSTWKPRDEQNCRYRLQSATLLTAR